MGVPKSSCSDMQAKKSEKKNMVIDLVLKKHEFHWNFDTKVQRLDLVKKRVWHVSSCNLSGLRGYEI